MPEQRKPWDMWDAKGSWEEYRDSHNYPILAALSKGQKFRVVEMAPNCREGIWEQTGKKWVPNGCCMTIYEIRETTTGQIDTCPAEGWVIPIEERDEQY